MGTPQAEQEGTGDPGDIARALNPLLPEAGSILDVSCVQVKPVWVLSDFN